MVSVAILWQPVRYTSHYSLMHLCTRTPAHSCDFRFALYSVLLLVTYADVLAGQSCPQQCASCFDPMFCCGLSSSKDPDNSNDHDDLEPSETQPLLKNTQPATQPGMMHPHPGVVPAVLPSPPPSQPHTPDSNGRGVAGNGNAAVG